MAGPDLLEKLHARHLGHALVGCASSVASGGKCGQGALSAAIPAAAGPIVNQLPFAAALVANTTLGGPASIAGGGKFANGAVTAAFGYLFNQALHRGFKIDLAEEEENGGHTIQMHVGKSEDWLLDRMNDQQYRGWFVDVVRSRWGSFPSLARTRRTS